MEPTIRIESRLGKSPKKERTELRSDHVSADDPSTAPRCSDTLARRLALAHYIERLIDAGRLRNYAEAAAVFGVTRARMSQLMDLALLPAYLQATARSPTSASPPGWAGSSGTTTSR